MAVAKSPFYIIEDFISPKVCEEIINILGIYSPDVDTEGKPIKMYRYKEDAEMIVYEQLMNFKNAIMQYYQTDYQGTETIQFEHFAIGVEPEPICENSDYLRKQWVRTKNRDLTGVLFLSDYNSNAGFDTDYECYGGNLEFPQHNFSFHPQRGTLIIYPSVPHFINATSMVEAGELTQARIHIATRLPFLYQPDEFPGDYKSWFKNYLT